MSQMSFSDLEQKMVLKTTMRERFLEEMDAIIPWQELEKVLRRITPKRVKGVAPIH